ncbi:hypothetical protein FGB62_289g02 [Gracilaria domingensis]|nr:hypothetical protein FGB62_289g02 [Gracilaria domingensis]
MGNAPNEDRNDQTEEEANDDEAFESRDFRSEGPTSEAGFSQDDDDSNYSSQDLTLLWPIRNDVVLLRAEDPEEQPDLFIFTVYKRHPEPEPGDPIPPELFELPYGATGILSVDVNEDHFVGFGDRWPIEENGPDRAAETSPHYLTAEQQLTEEVERHQPPLIIEAGEAKLGLEKSGHSSLAQSDAQGDDNESEYESSIAPSELDPFSEVHFNDLGVHLIIDN